ncbi:hypothetical protein LJC24_02510 [Desulfococcaceae bacterium OttesenSCG-928-F15]|nr:hypothetical protein [Desulfococcaceae bacterium OttesenSCG-928-F15]
MQEKFTEEMLEASYEKLPSGLSRRLQRIPRPERLSVLEEAGVPLSRMGEEMEEEDARALDKAIRYRDSKAQLIRMTLLAKIRDEVSDPYISEDMAAFILSRHPLNTVHEVYSKEYQGRDFSAFLSEA